MSAFTNYAENKILDAMLRGQSLTFPTNWYVGLLTSAPSDSSAGVEVSGGDYQRCVIAANLASWYATQGGGSILVSSGSSGLVTNAVDLEFATPSDEWGEVGWAALYDAASAGNMWMYCALAEAKTIFANDIVMIPQTVLQVSLA